MLSRTDLHRGRRRIAGGMPTKPTPPNDPPTCPVCKGELRFLTSGALGGPLFYAEAYTYECPTHGVVFLTREGLRGHGPDNAGGDSPLVPAPRKPMLPVKPGSIAIPEPDSN